MKLISLIGLKWKYSIIKNTFAIIEITAAIQITFPKHVVYSFFLHFHRKHKNFLDFILIMM